jgi:F-type H+-transporting ATPase subunit a
MSATTAGGVGGVPPQDAPVRRPGPGAGDLEPKKPVPVKKILLAIGAVYLAGLVALIAIYGFKGTRNKTYEPQNEFKLKDWVPIHLGSVDLSITKAVMYLLIAGALTCVTMIWVARRMQQRPNKVQTAVEAIYQLMRDNITGSAMSDDMARKWFPFIATLFLFILFSNLIGYIPLPTNTENEITIFGAHIPAFSIYAATANLSIPLVLALVVFFSYTFEGVRAKGPLGYLKGLIPAGVKGGIAVFIFGLEVLSNLMRILSLTIRLFANILAGHLIILFFSGALAVLLGVAWLGWFALPFGIIVFAFEVGLVAALQAFIFATLTAIYLGGAVAAEH